jgi:hypothetical protein
MRTHNHDGVLAIGFTVFISLLAVIFTMAARADPPDNRPPDNRPPDRSGGDAVAESVAESSATAATGEITIDLDNVINIPDEALGAQRGAQTLSTGETTLIGGDTNVSVVTENPDDITIRNTATGRAPTVMSPNPCHVPRSIGLGLPGFNTGAGTTVEDEHCTLRGDSLTWKELGLPEMGIWLMCHSVTQERAREVDEKPKGQREAASDASAQECLKMVKRFQDGRSEPPPTEPAEVVSDEEDPAIAALRIELEGKFGAEIAALKSERDELVADYNAQIQQTEQRLVAQEEQEPVIVMAAEPAQQAAPYPSIRKRLIEISEDEEWLGLVKQAEEYEAERQDDDG